MVTKDTIIQVIKSIPNFKEKAIEAGKEFMKNTWCFAYNVTEAKFCHRNVSWMDYCKNEYFGIIIDVDGKVLCNELFEEHTPLMPKAIDYIEL